MRSNPGPLFLIERDGPGSDATRDVRGTGISPSEVRTPTELRDLVRSVAGDVDRMRRAALHCGDFDLITRSTEASHALHRAVVALEDGEPITG